MNPTEATALKEALVRDAHNTKEVSDGEEGREDDAV